MRRPSAELVAALFHGPGLRFLYGPLSTRALRENSVAALATLAIMTAAGLATRAWPPVIGAWIIGHVAWSLRLRALVRQGRALAVS